MYDQEIVPQNTVPENRIAYDLEVFSKTLACDTFIVDKKIYDSDKLRSDPRQVITKNIFHESVIVDTEKDGKGLSHSGMSQDTG